MVDLVLIKSVNDMIRMSRIHNGKIESTVEFEPTVDTLGVVEDYRVNGVDDLEQILEKYQDINRVSGAKPEFEIVEDSNWTPTSKTIDTKTLVIKYRDNFYEIVYERTLIFGVNYNYTNPKIFRVLPEIVTTTTYKRNEN